MQKLKLLILAITLIVSYSTTAQVAVNTDGSSPNSSAMLDVKSDTSGILIPRMTQNQRIQIFNPATGLMVYQTDELSGFYYYDGWVWDKVASRTNLLSIIEYLQNGVTDICGNNYQTILIGNQVWMAENLATTKYNDGTSIPNVTDPTDWAALTTAGYCWFQNDSATYAPTYGALYNWHTVNWGTLCPSGWHVPSDAEWKIMEMHLGMTQTEADGWGFRGTDEGGKLKEVGFTHWWSPNAGATNSSGFTALPSGEREEDGSFFTWLGPFGEWWSATEFSSSHAWIRELHCTQELVARIEDTKTNGFSVRCVKDD